ncbi:tetratricopeptide repeat protein [Marinigracilibium pacificum]|uniref:Tetratricopeptide repeat protein n=1 Tax=Marinigracilibium pacificum TaxID=2729599 RepID=A0A848J0S3_9BACT|nr:tetratricopeptide repeat protein [Marinigracilibium pacificum]NMM48150.1 tetratricopeptide repeat protein [Marinigracilibium pacificum]
MYYNDTLDTIETLIINEKYDHALNKIEQAFHEGSDDPYLYALKARIYNNKENYKGAIDLINKAISENPEEDYFLFIKAQIKYNQSDFSEAEHYIRESIQQFPHSHYFSLLTAILFKQKKYKEAEKSALKGLELDAENEECRNLLALIYNITGKKDIAKNHIDGLLEQNPENDFAHVNAGYQELAKGNYKKAKEHYATALMIDPTSEVAKSGMLEAVKSSNFLYRWILKYQIWLSTLSKGVRIAFLIGLVVIVQVVPVLIPFYLVLIFSTWFIGPVSDVILLIDKYARNLLEKKTYVSAIINAGLYLIAIVSLTAGFTIDTSFLVLGFSIMLATIPIYKIDTISNTIKSIINIGIVLAFIGLGAFEVINAFVLNGEAGKSISALLILTIVYSWFSGILED